MKKKSKIRRRIKVPDEIVFLGYVLDAIIEKEGKVIKVKNEWHNWYMATTPGAEKLVEGKARLFLLDSGMSKNIRRKPSKKAKKTFSDWHLRDPKITFELGVPDDFPYRQGRITRIGYASDKWSKPGQYVDYDHDFREGGGVAPIIRTDTKDISKSRGAVCKGGTMRITSRGIA